jgi:uncharacterized membrane protein YsdA (DUF1294 family)
MIPVLIAIVLIAIIAFVFFRWFERYRYTEAWRQSEFRDWAFGFLMWFGGLFGHRLPPPPQTKIEFATKDKPDSGGAALSDHTPDEEQ